MNTKREFINFNLMLEAGPKSFTELFTTYLQLPLVNQYKSFQTILPLQSIIAEIQKLEFKLPIETVNELLLHFNVLVRKVQLRPKNETEVSSRVRRYREIVKKVGEDLKEELESVLEALKKEKEY